MTNQSKFAVGKEVRDSDGNSLSSVYEVLKVFWWKATSSNYRDCFKYILCNKDNVEEVKIKLEYELKDADELCPYEVYGNKMVGKAVQSVNFTRDELVITFAEGYVAKFNADCCQNVGYLEFEGR